MRTLAVILAMMGAPLAAQDAVVGKDLFDTHCATCHGLLARGNGPMGQALIVQPADLTRLAARNDGVFPTVLSVQQIDGRYPIPSHGFEMPVYGPFFGPDETFIRGEDGQPILTSQPVVDLLAYLESLQRE